jgi:hypothetical protein
MKTLLLETEFEFEKKKYFLTIYHNIKKQTAEFYICYQTDKTKDNKNEFISINKFDINLIKFSSLNFDNFLYLIATKISEHKQFQEISLETKTNLNKKVEHWNKIIPDMTELAFKRIFT